MQGHKFFCNFKYVWQKKNNVFAFSKKCNKCIFEPKKVFGLKLDTFFHISGHSAASVVEKVPDDDDEVVVEDEETSKEPSEDEKARDLRLMHLRKGFRLSSMCWDDWNIVKSCIAIYTYK